MSRPNSAKLANLRVRELLETAYADFHSSVSRESDPISVAHGFVDARDREVAAFIAALLAYGNVRTILNSVREVMTRLTPSPYDSLTSSRTDLADSRFVHRFTTGDDFSVVFSWLRHILAEHGSLENFFVATRHPLDAPMKVLLSDFVTRLFALPLAPPEAAILRRRERSLHYLVSDPERGSACKRLNMFLRWVVRPADGIDLGLWKKLHPGQLVLPVDTHLLQTLRALKWTTSKTATWKVAEAATIKLRTYSADDPIRYDFALCHLSMAGNKIHRYKRSSHASQLE